MKYYNEINNTKITLLCIISVLALQHCNANGTKCSSAHLQEAQCAAVTSFTSHILVQC